MSEQSDVGAATHQPTGQSDWSKYVEYGQAADEIQRIHQSGRVADPVALAAKYPELKAEMHEIIASLAVLDEMAERNVTDPYQQIIQEQRLGDFQIVREVGRGGMGVVYEAEQLSLGRRVALKVLPFAFVLDRHQLQRFKNEAMAAAALEHPNIVGVHSVGCERAVHFYAMQYVEGQTVAEIIGELQQSLHSTGHSHGGLGQLATDLHSGSRFLLASCDKRSERSASRSADTNVSPQAPISTNGSAGSRKFFHAIARLGIQAADALEHAHAMGVVHRDIKPSNLIVDKSGHLWITDFGLAMVESNPNLTMTGDVLGTLRYMSPEQALAKRAVVDHRTDIYSLGATLYELLTLRPAYTGTDRQDLLRRLAVEEPAAPRRVNRSIPVELETIVMKAMAKDPVDRYANAAELAQDLQCIVEDHPIRARRPTLNQRAARWLVRNKALIAAVSVILVLTTFGLAVSNLLIAEQRNRAIAAGQREKQQRRDAQRQRDNAIQNFYLADMRQAARDWSEGPASRLLETLENHYARPGRTDLRRWEWYYFLSMLRDPLLDLQGAACHPSISWTPDGKCLITTNGDEKTTIWDPVTRRVTATLKGHSGSVLWAAIEPDGSRLATAGEDTTIRIWDLASKQQVGVLEGNDEAVHWVSWSPTGGELASLAVDGTLKFWDVDSGRVRASCQAGRVYRILFAKPKWSPDGRRFALARARSANQTIIWDTDTGRELHSLHHDKYLQSVAWKPDNRTVATCAESNGEGPTTKVWDVENGECVFSVSDHHAYSVAWHPNGELLATATNLGYVDVWNANTGDRIHRLVGHQGGVSQVVWSHDGMYLVSGGQDQTIRIWNAGSGELVRILRGHTGDVTDLEFSPDDSYLVSFSWLSGRELKLWDLTQSPWTDLGDGKHILKYATLSRDAQRIATVRDDRTIDVWETATGQNLRTLSLPQSDAVGIGWRALQAKPLVWSLDERHIAWTNSDRVWVWDTLTNRSVSSIPVPTYRFGQSDEIENVEVVAWSPSGQRFAVAMKNDIAILDAATGETLLAFRAHDMKTTAVTWSQQGRLASGSWDGTVRIWDPTNGQLLHILPHAADGYGYIAAVAWSPDGARLASGGHDNRQLKIWDAVSGKMLVASSGHAANINCLAWHPGGERLATFAGDNTVRLWDTESGQEVIALRPGKRFDTGTLAWSASGKRLVLASQTGTVKVWNASSGVERAATGRVSAVTQHGPTASPRWFGGLNTARSTTSSSQQDAPVSPGWGSWASSDRPAIRAIADEGDELVSATNLHNAALAAIEEGNTEEASRLLRDEREIRARLDRRVSNSNTRMVYDRAWAQLGQAFYRVGKWDEALHALQKATAYYDSDAAKLSRDVVPRERLWYLTLTLAQLGEKEKARSYFDRLVSELAMQQNAGNEDQRFRALAAELLGIRFNGNDP